MSGEQPEERCVRPACRRRCGNTYPQPLAIPTDDLIVSSTRYNPDAELRLCHRAIVKAVRHHFPKGTNSAVLPYPKGRK